MEASEAGDEKISPQNVVRQCVVQRCHTAIGTPAGSGFVSLSQALADEIHGFLNANLLHKKLTADSKLPQPSSECGLVVGVEASQRRASDHNEFTGVGL